MNMRPILVASASIGIWDCNSLIEIKQFISYYILNLMFLIVNLN